MKVASQTVDCAAYSVYTLLTPDTGHRTKHWSDSSCRTAEQQNEFSDMRMLNVLWLSALHNEGMWIVWMVMARHRAQPGY